MGGGKTSLGNPSFTTSRLHTANSALECLPNWVAWAITQPSDFLLDSVYEIMTKSKRIRKGLSCLLVSSRTLPRGSVC